MELMHNITSDRFSGISTEPMNSDIPNCIFVRKEGEGPIIKRAITLTGLSSTDRVIIEAFREYAINDIEYIQKYKFTIVSDNGKSGLYDDGYAYLSVQGGRLLKTKLSKPSIANKGLEKIKKLGYVAAQELHEKWITQNQEEPEDWPMDSNGFPDRKEFEKILNQDLWEIGFEYMNETPSLAKVLERCGTDKVGYAYFDGVHQYMDEHFKNTD